MALANADRLKNLVESIVIGCHIALSKPHQVERIQWLQENRIGFTLEVGCNYGLVLDAIGGHVGVDIDPSYAEIASALSPDLKFVVGNATKLPFLDKTFQTVAIPNTLEHLDIPAGVLLAVQEACRVAWQRVLITIPDGSKDTDLECLLHLFPQGGQTIIKRTEYFILIRYDLEQQA